MTHIPIPTLRSQHIAGLRSYAVAVAVVIVALLLSALMRPIVTPNPFLIIFAAIAISAAIGGLGPSLVAIAVAVMGVNYLFIPPLYTFKAAPLDLMRLGAFSIVAILISGLSAGRRRAEQAANERREELEVTLAGIGDAVLVTDVAGRVTFLNDAAARLTGWSAAEAYGQPAEAVFDTVDAETRRAGESSVTRVLREGVTVGLTSHALLRSRDGAERPIDSTGAPIRGPQGRLIGAVLVFRDVSAREQAEAARAALLAREQEARAAAEAAREQLAFLAEAGALLSQSLDYDETLQWIARLCVPRLADWCAVETPGVDGELVMEVIAHVDPAKERWARELRARFPGRMDMPVGSPLVIRSGRSLLYPEISDEMVVQAASDAEELALLRQVGYRSMIVVPLRAGERVIGALGLISTDESGRRYTPDDMALAEELARRAAFAMERSRLFAAERAAHAAAEEAIRLRDQFLSIASHELKTPLTSLLLQTELLQRRAERAALLPERERRSLQLIVDQSHRLDRMISALLDVSRLELGQLSLERAPVDLCALARRMAAEAAPLSEAHVVICDAPAEALLIEGDELRLEQVLQNLLQNAIKYSPDGGPVEILVTTEGERVCVAVRDRGIGLPEEALPQLFERFFRASNVDPRQISGLGVGLYVVREIVRLHGGEVRAARRPGGGSDFMVCLPRAEQVPPGEPHRG